MNVLFLTIAYPEREGDRNIYTDLMQEFSARGDKVYVICQRERRHGKPTEFKNENGVNVLRVRTGNIKRTSNIIEKGLATLLIDWQFIAAINKYLNNVKFDLVLYSTPPITFERVVKYIKARDKCKSYLLLKDIFPQNAVDIGLMKKGGLIWRYFRAKEKRLYEVSDHIGCMSRANVEYLLRHNPDLDPAKVEECPNSIKPRPLSIVDEARRLEIRKRWGIPQDAVVFVYGGNLGLPQGIDFLLTVLDSIQNRYDIFFLIVGSGTEYGGIKAHLETGDHSNTRLISFLPKDDYDQLLDACDVGMIFLDARFTIPNFPSRLTGYMESALPVLAATDENTDIKDVLKEANCGLWVKSGDLAAFMEAVNTLAADPSLRRGMGLNGRCYLEKYYTVSRGYDIITSHFK
ncbi:glycosyltransferase family 4 protein [Syntrophothermus lipocalidus]|uniref:Glycosyl transferase group 1 n=1 Tax=Syntrophothermus lipocalidus (strain DSM 12680 / TGB-C1) TaxID=643648 RepID=D7CJ73_SYNLT|nr:glycosyltransferase family 4 protein [Syntrophothermus lipocalidus]ADI00962.1 glycosyl transferase group 1 [Syntrophothermus lipocalidus DSM 12680]